MGRFKPKEREGIGVAVVGGRIEGAVVVGWGEGGRGREREARSKKTVQV